MAERDFNLPPPPPLNRPPEMDDEAAEDAATEAPELSPIPEQPVVQSEPAMEAIPAISEDERSVADLLDAIESDTGMAIEPQMLAPPADQPDRVDRGDMPEAPDLPEPAALEDAAPPVERESDAGQTFEFDQPESQPVELAEPDVPAPAELQAPEGVQEGALEPPESEPVDWPAQPPQVAQAVNAGVLRPMAGISEAGAGEDQAKSVEDLLREMRDLLKDIRDGIGGLTEIG